jgi:hypothetical protein
MRPGRHHTKKEDIIEIGIIIFAWLIALAVVYYVIFKIAWNR